MIQDSFQKNEDGRGAVCWRNKYRHSCVLWIDPPFLKSIYLRNRQEIIDFAEYMLGFQYTDDMSFAEICNAMTAHEGEWFDPPENFALYRGYDEVEFQQLRFGTMERMYEIDVPGGRIHSASPETIPPGVIRAVVENKVWFRFVKAGKGMGWESRGPYENHLAAARAIFQRFFE